MAGDYQIKISTPADLSGAQATKTALDAITTSTGGVAAGSNAAGDATGRFVDTAGKLREANGRFVETGNSAKEAGHKISEASHEADHLIESLKTGMSIDIGHRIVEGIAEIPNAFREAIAEGVHFNSEIEKLSINFGSAMRASDPGKFLDFAQAKAAGVDALEIIRQKANELGMDFTEVAHGFSINMAALREGGVKDTQQQIDLMIRLNQITAAKGISGMQSQRDIIDLLQGRGERTIFGKELEPLGITNESIKQAREMGTLADLILSKTQAYGEAAAASADTFGAAQQRLTSETQQLYGEIAKPVFEELKEQYRLLTAEIEKPEVREALKGLGYDIASVVEAGGGLARFAVENAGVLVPLATGIGAVSLALAVYKTAQIASIVGAKLTSVVAETAATEAHAAAVAADTVAVEANTVAREAGAGVGWGTAVGAAGAGAFGGTVALGLLPGAAIFAARQHEANQEAERDQEVGEESSAHSDRAGKFYTDIQRASSEEEQLKQRKALNDEQAAVDQQIKDLNLKEAQADAEAETNTEATGVSPLYDPKRAAQIAALKEYATELENIQERFSKLAGKKPLADTDAQKGEDALAKYKSSAEYRLSQAEASGDQNAIDNANYDGQVDKKREHLEKTYGLKPEVAEQQAQQEVSADDEKKENDKDAQEKARDDEKAKREAEAAQKQADRDAKTAADKAARLREALTDETEETNILNARAKGEKDVADALEKQRDIRKESLRLQGLGLDATDATAKATDKINAQNAAQDRTDADRASRHKGKGDDGPAITYGYSDPIHDAPGQLHTGHLQTSTLDGSPSADRFANVPDATATALANAPTAAGALAAAPSYVPSFGAASGGLPLSGMLGLALTAGQGLAPGIPSAVSPAGNPAGSPTPTSTAPADGGASSSLSTLKSAADAAATALNKIKAPSGGGSSGGSGGGYNPNFDADDAGIVDAMSDDQ